MSSVTPGRRVTASAALLAIVAMFGALLALSLPASADTAANQVVTTATTPNQSNVSPNGPLTGLHDLDTVTVDVSATGTGSPANVIYSLDARLCRAGVNISLVGQFNASAGNCIATPLSTNSSAFVQKTFGAPNTSGSVSFIVGTGTEASHVGPGSPITCDAFHPCSLWLREGVPTGIVASGSAFVHYDLTFAGTPDAPIAPIAAAKPGGTALVSWTAPRATGPWPVQTYDVVASPGGATCSAVAPATSCTVSGLDPLQTYTFGVTLTNQDPSSSGPSYTSAASTVVLNGKGAPKITADLAASNTTSDTTPRVGAFTVVEGLINNGPQAAVGSMLISVSSATESAIAPDAGLVCAAPVPSSTGFTQRCSSAAALAPGASLSATLTLVPPTDQKLSKVAVSNTVSPPKTSPAGYLDPNATGNKVSKTIHVLDVADLAASFTGASSVSRTGSEVVSGTLSNSGPNPVYAKVTIAVGYGSETAFTASPALSCAAPKPNAAGTGYSRVCTTIGPLASGSSLPVQLTLAPSGNPLKHLMTVSTTAAKVSGYVTDPNPANNKSALKVQILDSADLATTLAAPSSVGRAGTVTITGTITNNGPDAVAGQASVKLVGGTVSSFSSDPGLTCTGTTSVTCKFPVAIAAGTTLHFSIVVSPSTKLTVSSLTATSTVKVAGGANVTDPASGNDVATASVAISDGVM